MSGGGACGKRWGYAEVSVGTGEKLGESMRKWRGGWNCFSQGPDVRASCRMSGTPDVRWTRGGCPGSWIGDEHDELHGKNCNSEAKFGRIDGGIRGRDGKKLDQLDAKQIHGSNPTKLQHTNKSQKKLGFFWWGFSDLGRKQQNQARKHGVGAPKT